MNHEQLQYNVMALLDDELPAPERAAASAHLETCGDCRVLAERIMESRSLLRTDVPPESDRFVWAVMSRIRSLDQATAPSPLAPLRRWFAPFTAALALGGYIVLLVTPVSRTLSATEEVLLAEAQDVMPATWIVVPGLSAQGHVLDEEGEE